jgi:signal transduction histidine kinase
MTKSPNADLPTVPAPRSRLPAAAGALGALASSLGAVGLAGWILDEPALRAVIPGQASMKANTAIALLSQGVAVSLLAWRGDRPAWTLAARIAAALGALVGLLSFLEFALAADFGIDQLVFRDSGAGALAYTPGRMAPTTALNFLLLGAALAGRDLFARRIPWLADTLALTAVLIALTSATGIAVGVRPDRPLTLHTTQQALHTALGFIAVGLGIVALDPLRGLASLLARKDAGGSTARRLVPVAALVPLAAGLALVAGQRAGFFPPEFTTAALVVATVSLLSAAALAAAARLSRLDEERAGYARELEGLARDLEARVARRTEELRAANEELEAFCYSVSHDLRSPLQSIDGFAALALEDGASDAPRHLGKVRAAAKRMGELIEALLEMSRLGREELRREPVDLSRLAQDIAGELKGRAAERQAEFRIQEGLVASGDPCLLRIALWNLMENAWKFSGSRETALIEFAATDGPGGREYFVRDNGVGFDPSLEPQLFRAFHRLAEARSVPGHGVGLATVRKVIQRHGGTIRAEGEPGRGSTFRFRLGEGGSRGGTDRPARRR